MFECLKKLGKSIDFSLALIFCVCFLQIPDSCAQGKTIDQLLEEIAAPHVQEDLEPFSETQEKESGYSPFLNRIFQNLHKRHLVCGKAGVCHQQGACGTSRVIFSLCWILCAKTEPGFLNLSCVGAYAPFWRFSPQENGFWVKREGMISALSYLGTRLTETAPQTAYLRYGVCKVINHPTFKSACNAHEWQRVAHTCHHLVPESLTKGEQNKDKKIHQKV